MPEYQICNRCVMDTTDPNIVFDGKGICNHCKGAIELLKGKTIIDERKSSEKLQEIVQLLKESGKGKKYDCVAGLSGGVDSTYVVYLLAKHGVRVLAVHLDNGFNSIEATENIKSCVAATKVDLLTLTVDKDQYADAILAYIKSGVANCEAVTDSAIIKTMYGTAHKNGIKYIVTGHNSSSESIGTQAWGYTYLDKKNIQSILKRFGTMSHDSLELIDIKELIYYRLTKKVRKIELLDYLNYDKEKAKQELIEKVGWRDYGPKYGESVWTRFFQFYYLPKKFGYDKRKWHFSSLICANQMTREEALEELKKSPYPNEEMFQEDMLFICGMLGITVEELERYISMPPHNALEYPNNHRQIRMINSHNLRRAKRSNLR